MRKRIFLEVAVVILGSLLSAFAVYVFVTPASFAPSGIDGISVMLQQTTGLNAGYWSILFNAPLLLIAWFKLNRKYVLYTILFTVVSSLGMIIMELLQVPVYHAGIHIWIPALVSGVLMGFRTGSIMRFGGSTGGLDILASLIQKSRPHLNVEIPISILSYIVVGCSYFFYGDINSILLSVFMIFVFTQTMTRVLHSSRSAVEAKIITSHPTQFREDIILNLKHGATILDGKGMYSGDEKSMIISIINIRQMGELNRLAQKYPGSFVYYSPVTGVLGNFRWKKDDIAM